MPSRPQRASSRGAAGGRSLFIGIPSAGHLHDDSLRLVADALGVGPAPSRRVVLETADPSVHVVCLRPGDIPQLLADGAVQLGITGNNNVIEAGVGLEECADLGLCPGDLAVLVAEDDPAVSLPDLPAGVCVATQYPRCAERLLTARGWAASIRRIGGTAEAFLALGVTRAIVDVVSSGRSARANRLRVLTHLLHTTGCLYRSPSATPRQRRLADDVIVRLRRHRQSEAEACRRARAGAPW